VLQRRFVEGVFVEPRNTEVAAQVEQVEKAEVAGDDDDLDILYAGQHDDDAGDAGVFKAYPYIGARDRRVGIADTEGCCALVVRSSNDVLPCAVVVLVADELKRVGVVGTGLGEAVCVDGDAVELADGMAHVFAAVVEDSVGQAKHIFVEGEVGVECRAVRYGFEAVGNPVLRIDGRFRLRERGDEESECEKGEGGSFH